MATDQITMTLLPLNWLQVSLRAIVFCLRSIGECYCCVKITFNEQPTATIWMPFARCSCIAHYAHSAHSMPLCPFVSLSPFDIKECCNDQRCGAKPQAISVMAAHWHGLISHASPSFLVSDLFSSVRSCPYQLHSFKYTQTHSGREYAFNWGN